MLAAKDVLLSSIRETGAGIHRATILCRHSFQLEPIASSHGHNGHVALDLREAELRAIHEIPLLLTVGKFETEGRRRTFAHTSRLSGIESPTDCSEALGYFPRLPGRGY